MLQRFQQARVRRAYAICRARSDLVLVISVISVKDLAVTSRCRFSAFKYPSHDGPTVMKDQIFCL